VNVLGTSRGVCRDEVLGGTNSNQHFLSSRQDGLTTITYRRSLTSPEVGDRPFPTKGLASLVWAIGRMDKMNRPTFHRLWARSPVLYELGRVIPQRNCLPFLIVDEPTPPPWGQFQIREPSLRLFSLKVGPSGGPRGYEGITGQPGSDLAWYVNGLLVPELFLRREFTYSFQVEGGDDPHSPTHYHPLIITDEPVGGYEQMTEEERKKTRVLAGVEFTRRGQPRPTAAGRLCLWRHTGKRDRRLDSDLTTYQKFRNSLQLFCEEGGKSANLEVRPDNSWPDVVYYHSYTHPGMGWKINIVDRFGSTDNLSSSGSILAAHLSHLILIALFALNHLFRIAIM